jgi:MoaA/NifB/PqqE/SkfB family radical SAM enzyme
VTFGCNAKCVMCDSWQLSTTDDLSLAEIDRIYRQLPPLDAIRLTGGEPFVRPDMSAIYHSAIEHLRPLFVHISSNGFLTNRIVDFCRERDQTVPLELAISIDGVDDYHNEIRGTRSAFRSAWKTLTELAAQRSAWNLHLTVNQTVVNDEGLEQYEALSERLRPWGIEHHLIVAYAESATYSLDRERKIEQSGFSTFSELTPAKVEQVLQRARQEAAKLSWFRRKLRLNYLNGVADRILRGRATPPRACQALHAHMRLFPNGDVPVCQFNSQIIGNLRTQPFAEVWQSAQAAEQRSWVRGCSGCWAECEVAPNTIYTLDFS